MCTPGRCSWALFKNWDRFVLAYTPGVLRVFCSDGFPYVIASAFSTPAFFSTPAIYSCIFRSCIFHPCYLLLLFPLLYFPLPHFQRPPSAVYAAANSSVHPSVRPSHSGIVSKRDNAEGCGLHHRVAQCLWFSDAKNGWCGTTLSRQSLSTKRSTLSENTRAVHITQEP